MLFRSSWIIAAIAQFLFLAAGIAAAGQSRTVILVRHAERAGGMGADVPISETGRCRADALARMLSSAEIKSVYTSEVKRTQQTAEPLARQLGIQPQVVPANAPATLVSQLQGNPSGGTVLVVGHSNTIPDIVQRLSGQPVPPIADSEYDRLFILTLSGPQQATVLTLRYPGCSR